MTDKIMAIPFAGFYETWHAQIIEGQIELAASCLADRCERAEHEIGGELFNAVSWRKVYEAYAKEYAYRFDEILAKALDSLNAPEELNVPLAQFDRLEMPTEYNFNTDEIYVRFENGAAFIRELYDFMAAEFPGTLEDNLKQHFAPRSGFVPFEETTRHYENQDVENWPALMCKAIFEAVFEAAMLNSPEWPYGRTDDIDPDNWFGEEYGDQAASDALMFDSAYQAALSKIESEIEESAA